MLTPRLIGSALESCEAPPRQILLAYSGGVDSHVLLHLCAQDQALRDRLTAVHVHHGLQEQAEGWACHAEHTARALGVKFLLCRVDAHPKPGESPEEAARNARYAALQSAMMPGDVLLVAQHQDDQLETVLLQLLRGGGLLGLAGMPARLPFGRGTLVRPFLSVRKQRIDDYAAAQQLRWVEDPSNNESVYDRNFLRREILPLLKQRWPSCDQTVVRAAGHCAEAHALLTDMAAEAFGEVYQESDNTLSIELLNTFDLPRRRMIIRHWFRQMGLKMPSQAFLEQLFGHVIDAGANSDPVLCVQGCRIRRYRDRLYCLKEEHGEDMRDFDWPEHAESVKIGKRMILTRMRSMAGIPETIWLQSTVSVKFRCGGESIALPGRQGHRRLKNLYQEIGIPPWQRDEMPLIYLDGRLAAVADLWISSEFYREGQSACIRFALRPD
ncbi:tRNA lysidine(34) synthetase TilS [Methylomicrobium sp. Wu6]|uniref:tRNA lysidine(34) synthetase TilS n=1 Tax=Methylomicrobium sp. Wu6 TaxID=3107928 RepID=UPI002DD6A24F|nr:tRNA lysidine(34) synthetase TilS [Methylomicrobium sp. Wu6]MEC4748852.1 tRNA lysidine(34) synthetase TilS [Methylomicrobium sp. Wu6]